MAGLSEFPRLFEAGRIGKLRLKNRMIMPPMGTRYPSPDGKVTERQIAYYAARARGGVALVVVEAAVFMADLPMMVRIHDDSCIPQIARLADAIHGAGIPAVLQIALARGVKDRAIALGPSAMTAPATGLATREVTREEMAEVTAELGRVAGRAKSAGFDGVMIHGAHGYLIASFSSPLYNKRTDEYGGTLRNRTRFALDLVDSVRRNVGPDYAVIYRIMADEKFPGGFTIEEGAQMCVYLQEAGVDAIDVTAGGVVSEEWITPPMSMPPATNAPLGEAIKKLVKIPVMVAGKILDPRVAEAVLEKGQADFIDIGRALIADPDFPRKVMEGRLADIRPCIGCLKCREAIARPAPIACTVNIMTGREFEGLPPAAKAKRVLVIGGGPAGISAALTAAARGHRVTLWEESARLGGQLNVASVPPGKAVLAEFREFLEREVDRSNIKVELNKRIAGEDYRDFDAVVMAIGSAAAMPRIKGMEGKNVLSGRDVLAGKGKIGKEVIVIGGGYVGCEVAEFLADMGKTVTIIEVLPQLAADLLPRIRRLYIQGLDRRGVKAFVGVKSEEITDQGMQIVDKDGKSVLVEADTFVIAVGSKPNPPPSPPPKGPEVYAVGDCVCAASLLEAMQGGAEAARKL